MSDKVEDEDEPFIWWINTELEQIGITSYLFSCIYIDVSFWQKFCGVDDDDGGIAGIFRSGTRRFGILLLAFCTWTTSSTTRGTSTLVNFRFIDKVPCFTLNNLGEEEKREGKSQMNHQVTSTLGAQATLGVQMLWPFWEQTFAWLSARRTTLMNSATSILLREFQSSKFWNGSKT